ncbi:uncharacterized protein PFL1_02430 [Pseudozyma flocculosa PF-1]|uniref:Alpha/beta hydrolase fold-3 domain-containing protein n=1 Tax=Pseudozyma flocculosa TaxID=84751 RepID=A0A5C3F5G7_9BASI|nr:uncharacterized protein PFL1_02430 [Pseudozyma flocculosa PF-1]EPQ30315.1 hypothetical protein PFL1_02430 [Pseudozyma flocculosa PF-1]SPO39743.1 uncharacterized protein PSFLO_05224 [Pseudozyma flocculosa]
MSQTPSGHIDYRTSAHLIFYGPTLPHLENLITPSRHPQTLDSGWRVYLVVALRLAYLVCIVVPVHVALTLLSFARCSRRRWLDHAYPPSRLPARQPSWTLLRTLAVPLSYSILWAVSYGAPRRADGRYEGAARHTRLNRLGISYQGWRIDCEAVVIPPLPLPRPTAKPAPPPPNGKAHPDDRSEKQEGQPGPENGHPPRFDDAPTEDASELLRHRRPRPAPQRVPTQEAVGYEDDERVPPDVLRGDVAGQRFGVEPRPCPAFWLWKTHAAEVKHGKVTAVKPGSSQAGIGCGPALGPDERVVLYLVGGAYVQGHPLLSSIAASVCRTTSLRVLCVNYRKATSDDRAFPAALQDALAGWVYLTKRLGFRPRNVVLLGDSAGGGLCTSLQIYLSALMFSSRLDHGRRRRRSCDLGRARKLVLHSSWTDLTLRSPQLVEHARYDILSPHKLSEARDAYLRHVLPIPGRRNAIVDPLLDAAPLGKGAIKDVAERYDVDSHPVGSPAYYRHLARLAEDLPETIVRLGAFHPLFSPGIAVRENEYLRKALHLLGPPPPRLRSSSSSSSSEDDEKDTNDEEYDDDDKMEMLLTVGSIEVFQDQIHALADNLRSLSSSSSSSSSSAETGEQGGAPPPLSNVSVSVVEGLGEHHVYPIARIHDRTVDQVNALVRDFITA